MSLVGDITRGFADVATFGTNELLGNPAGKFAEQVMNPTDPNAAYNDMVRENNANQLALARENIALEKEFAQNGISWRVADAARNGISPLAALGAAEPSFSPVSTLFNNPAPPEPSLLRNMMTAGVSELGAGLGRSLIATQSAEQKAAAAIELARRTKENEMLDVQIALAKKQLALQPGTPPGLPDRAWTTVMNRDGTTSIVPSRDMSMAAHGEPFGGMIWQIHNGLIPAVRDLWSNVFTHKAQIGSGVPDVRGSRMRGGN